jgi:hypothetical protein
LILHPRVAEGITEFIDDYFSCLLSRSRYEPAHHADDNENEIDYGIYHHVSDLDLATPQHDYQRDVECRSNYPDYRTDEEHKHGVACRDHVTVDVHVPVMLIVIVSPGVYFDDIDESKWNADEVR